MLASTRTHEAHAVLNAPSAGEELLADYRSTGLSLTNHPLALLRDRLAKFRVQPATVLNGYRNGQLARASGLVTHRQRPETAKGVIFVTLEDETGAVNVIVWPQVAESQRKPLLASTLLTVYERQEPQLPLSHGRAGHCSRAWRRAVRASRDLCGPQEKRPGHWPGRCTETRSSGQFFCCASCFWR
jgi:DNA polymerase III alpha subunit